MDTDFLKNFPKECDNAISTKNIEKVDALIEKLKELESRLERSPLLTQVWYCFQTYTLQKQLFIMKMQNFGEIKNFLQMLFNL